MATGCGFWPMAMCRKQVKKASEAGEMKVNNNLNSGRLPQFSIGFGLAPGMRRETLQEEHPADSGLESPRCLGLANLCN